MPNKASHELFFRFAMEFLGSTNWNQSAICHSERVHLGDFDWRGSEKKFWLNFFLFLFFVFCLAWFEQMSLLLFLFFFLCDHKKISVTNVSKSLLSFSQLSFPMQPFFLRKNIKKLNKHGKKDLPNKRERRQSNLKKERNRGRFVQAVLPAPSILKFWLSSLKYFCGFFSFLKLHSIHKEVFCFCVN